MKMRTGRANVKYDGLITGIHRLITRMVDHNTMVRKSIVKEIRQRKKKMVIRSNISQLRLMESRAAIKGK
ncbi:hypothetical protein D3C73_1234030 [compost metagenome]